MLVLLAVHKHQIAWRLIAACQQRTEHHRIGAGHKRLTDISRVLQTAIGDERNPSGATRLRRLVDRRDLGDANAGNNASGADGTGANAHLNGIRASIDQRLRTRLCSNVSADDLDLGKRGFAAHPPDHVQSQLCLTVSRIHHEHVHACLGQK